VSPPAKPGDYLTYLLEIFDGSKVIYAAACRLGAARLQRENIVFKQTPYALAV